MEILNLNLTNFRNFSSQNITFDKNLTVIIGPNGSGKSNILEAIALLCGIRSDRVETDADLPKFAKTEAKIEGKIKFYDEEKVLTINFLMFDERFVKKSYLIDSVKKRFADFTDFLAIIVFHPRDLELVSGSPSLRRHHLDNFLCALDREYYRNVSAYHKIITRRNKVLQRINEGKSRAPELDFWDSRLITHGRYISEKRQEFFEFLKSVGVQPLIGISWRLNQSLISNEKLIKNRERDIAAKMTLSGPHRDDFQFICNQRNLEFFGSRGEQRMAVLTLKLAEIEYHQVKRAMRPILALDDIFSELDWEHREAILQVISKQQTIITAAEADSVPQKILKKAKLVRLS